MRPVSQEQEIEDLESFLQGNKLSQYITNLLKRRIEALRSKMLSKLRNHEDRHAGEYRAAMDEIIGIPELIKQRIKTIRESQRSR